MSQTLQSVLCITTNKYLVRVLVVLLHARFSVVSPIPFLLAAIFSPVHPYIGSTTVLPDTENHHVCTENKTCIKRIDRSKSLRLTVRVGRPGREVKAMACPNTY